MDEKERVENLTETIKKKKLEKYDHQLEEKIRKWIGESLPEYQENCLDKSISLRDLLGDGIILCKLINKISGKSLTKFSTMKMAFKQIENISNYLTACTKLGMNQTELFETLDLYESRDLNLVLLNLHALLFIDNKYKDELKNKLSETSDTSSPSKKVSRLLAGKDQIQQTPSPVSKDYPRISVSPMKSKEEIILQPSVSSLEDDVVAKEEFKYNPELEQAARKWILQVLEITDNTDEPFGTWLKSGVILCRLINKIKPNTITSIYDKNLPYRQMENIGNYLKACVTLGLETTDLFETPDLFNEKNLNLVINNIHVLANHVCKQPGWKGPIIDDVRDSKSLFSATLTSSTLDSLDIGKEEEITPEQQELIDWVNSKFEMNLVDIKLNNLSSDIKSGVKLIKLLEIIFKVNSIGPYHENPSLVWHVMQNATLILKFISTQTYEKVEGCRASDIVTGRASAIAKLLFYLRDKYDLEYYYNRLINDMSSDDTGSTGLIEEDDYIEFEYEEGNKYHNHLIHLMEEEGENIEIINVEPEKGHTTKSPTEKEVKPEESKDKQPITKEDKKTSVKDETKDEKTHLKVIIEPSKDDKVIVDIKDLKPQDDDDIKKSEDVESSSKQVDKVKDKKSRRSIDKKKSSKDKKKDSSQDSPSTKKKNKKSKSKLSIDKASKKEKRSSSSSLSNSFSEQSAEKDENVNEPIIEESKPKEEPKPSPPIEEKEEPKQSEPIEEKEESKQSQPIEEKEESKPSQPSEENSQANVPPLPQLPDASNQTIETKAISEPSQSESPRFIESGGGPKRIRVHRAKLSSNTALDRNQLKVLKAQIQVRQHIANEILETEKNYLKNLTSFKQDFLDRIKREGIMTDAEYYSLFSNLETIISLHIPFERRLRERIEKWNDFSIISDIFLDHSDFIYEYKPYLQNYSKGMVSMYYIKKKYPRFVQMIQQYENELLKTAMHTIDSFIIMPVQRIPRYILLLREMKKYTQETSKEWRNLELAIQKIDDILKKLNENIDRGASERLERVLKIVDMIQGETSLLNKDRYFLREGEVNIKKLKLNDKQSLSKEEKKKLEKLNGLKCYLFLFNNCMIICEHIKNTKNDDTKLFTFVHELEFDTLKEVISEKDLQENNIETINGIKVKHSDKKYKELQFYMAFDTFLLTIQCNKDAPLWAENINNSIRV